MVCGLYDPSYAIFVTLSILLISLREFSQGSYAKLRQCSYSSHTLHQWSLHYKRVRGGLVKPSLPFPSLPTYLKDIPIYYQCICLLQKEILQFESLCDTREFVTFVLITDTNE